MFCRHYAIAGCVGQAYRLHLRYGRSEAESRTVEGASSILVRCNDQLHDYVEHLEHDYDLQQKAEAEASLGAPQAEQLVKEAEAFLRQMGN